MAGVPLQHLARAQFGRLPRLCIEFHRGLLGLETAVISCENLVRNECLVGQILDKPLSKYGGTETASPIASRLLEMPTSSFKLRQSCSINNGSAALPEVASLQIPGPFSVSHRLHEPSYSTVFIRNYGTCLSRWLYTKEMPTASQPFVSLCSNGRWISHGSNSVRPSLGALPLRTPQKSQLYNPQVCKGFSTEEFVQGKKGEEDKGSSHSSTHQEKPSHKTALEGGVKYNVVRINKDGSWHSLCLHSAELGIHPRDIDVLASANSFVPQRATIAVRNDKVVVRMENVRALVARDYVLLFEARSPRTFKDKGVLGVAFTTVFKTPKQAMLKARETFAESLAQAALAPPAHPLEAMPFHLRMMECLLEETSNFFNQKAERLKVVVERVLQELTDDVNMGGLQRLLPLKRALTEVEHDVRDTHVAMDKVLNSDDALQALCLDNKYAWPMAGKSTHTESGEGNAQYPTLRQAAADMFLSYQREVDDAGGALEELRKDMVAASEIWELGLDTTRNRIIRMNLIISSASLSLSVAAVVAGFFGMNLRSGLEDHPSIFWWVVGGATTTSFALCTGLILVLYVWPRLADKQRAQNLAGLHDLLHHIDDIDDIFQAVGREMGGKSVTQQEFEQFVRMHPSAQFMKQRELDLMFRLFDINRDRFLEDELNVNQTRQHRARGCHRNDRIPQTSHRESWLGMQIIKPSNPHFLKLLFLFPETPFCV